MTPWLVWRGLRYKNLRQAELEAKELISLAQDEASALDEDVREQVADSIEQLEEAAEPGRRKLEEQIRELESRCEELTHLSHERLNQLQSQVDRRQHRLKRFEDLVSGKIRRKNQRQQECNQLKNQYQQQLSQNHQLDVEQILYELSSEWTTEFEQQQREHWQDVANEIEKDAERIARRLLSIAIGRIERPASHERGIGFVIMTSPEMKDKLMGVDHSTKAEIEQTLGVDLVFNEEHASLAVSGFDPVRRELGRRILEKLKSEPRVDRESITRLLVRIKRQLVNQIKSDGDGLSKELGLRMPSAIRQTLGALRHRYSFTQNQYFHVGEVGWLCGLLAAELGVDPVDGRRAGVLHDIGKALDHSLDGGHAMIGADFIAQHGELPHIVHAVRAHHFDETPATALAYLVIAADAISGARPGARRSTVETYHQKMSDLEAIGKSFDGVIATLVLSAGREIRLLVDSRRVSDQEALELSFKVAQKIEAELSYPGQIKVMIVRETQAIDIAR